MRQPTYPEVGYLDFDGFFASCEQFKHKHLRGKPVGIIPMPKGSTCVISVSREAKAFGIKNVMPVGEAQRLCPDIILWPQNPDLYRRAHNELLSEICMVVPIEAVKSIDEMTFTLDQRQRHDPIATGERIKSRIRAVTGEWISCSIGFGPNRLLAKMACKASKPAGNLAWWPDQCATILRDLELDDVPGIGGRMKSRLFKARVWNMECLLKCGPREMRGLWGSVTGERMWYALNGYAIKAEPTSRGMYGHSRILPPTHRTLETVKPMARLLTIKAARRMRREYWRASSLYLGLAQVSAMGGHYWHQACWMPQVADYSAILSALTRLWTQAEAEIDPRLMILRVDVSLGELTPLYTRQLDLLMGDEAERLGAEAIADAMDRMNRRYGETVLSLGPWTPPPGDHTGGKISYTRIPRKEDFS